MVTSETGLSIRTSEIGAEATPGTSLPVTADPVLGKVDVMGRLGISIWSRSG